MTYNSQYQQRHSARCNSTIPKFNFSDFLLRCQLSFSYGSMANGIKLGEMNRLLLEKIEENTLYIIHLKKEIEELKNNRK